MSRKVMQQALEAMDREIDTRRCEIDTLRAMNALRAALAEPAAPQGEPVAWMVYTIDGKSAFVTDNPKDFTQDHRALPLYTTPRATAGEQR